MTLLAITTDQASQSDDGLFIYELADGTLTQLSANTFTGTLNSPTKVGKPAWSDDNTRLIVPSNGGSFGSNEVVALFSVASDGTITRLDGFAGPNTANVCAWVPGTTKVLVGHARDGSGTYSGSVVFLADTSGDTIVRDSQTSTGSTYGNCKALAVSPGGTKAVAIEAGADKPIQLLGISGSTLSLTAASTDTLRAEWGGATWHPTDNNIFAVYAQEAAVNKVKVYSVSGGSFTELASVGTGSITPGGIEWNRDGSKIYTWAEAYSWDGSSLTQLYSFGSTSDVGDIALLRPDRALVKGIDVSSGTDLFAYEPGASSATQTDSETLGDFLTVTLETFNPLGPETDEELFQASYADASAADPKATALIQPTDVQQSIDTDVFNLKDGPSLHVVEAIFDVGELDELEPYNPATGRARVYFVRDDQPGLREGKNLLLKGYRIRDATDPGVPVTCIFWSPD